VDVGKKESQLMLQLEQTERELKAFRDAGNAPKHKYTVIAGSTQPSCVSLSTRAKRSAIKDVQTYVGASGINKDSQNKFFDSSFMSYAETQFRLSLPGRLLAKEMNVSIDLKYFKYMENNHFFSALLSLHGGVNDTSQAAEKLARYIITVNLPEGITLIGTTWRDRVHAYRSIVTTIATLTAVSITIATTIVQITKATPLNSALTRAKERRGHRIQWQP
jgi:hypothetical protein